MSQKHRHQMRLSESQRMKAAFVEKTPTTSSTPKTTNTAPKYGHKRQARLQIKVQTRLQIKVQTLKHQKKEKERLKGEKQQ